MVWHEFLHNAAIVATLVVLEGLLSADNALVLAVLVKHLPKTQQKKALKYGIAGAFIFRGIGVLLATYLIAYWQFKAAGAAYLLYLAVRHFFLKDHKDTEAGAAAGAGFWKTVALVELTDIAFSVDSIVAAVAMSSKLWVVYLGGILGIITMRFVAGMFLRLLERFPRLEGAAYVMVGWIGIKLGAETIYQLTLPPETVAAMVANHQTLHVLPAWLFWSVMGLILIAAVILSRRDGAIVRHAADLKEFEAEEKQLLPSRKAND